MRFITSHWQGFEIDSSEFSVAFFTDNPFSLIKAFLNSSYFGENIKISGGLVSKFLTAIEMAKKINLALVEQISFKGLNLLEFCDIIRNRGLVVP